MAIPYKKYTSKFLYVATGIAVLCAIHVYMVDTTETGLLDFLTPFGIFLAVLSYPVLLAASIIITVQQGVKLAPKVLFLYVINLLTIVGVVLYLKS